MNLLVTAAFILALVLVAEKINNSLGDSNNANATKEELKYDE